MIGGISMADWTPMAEKKPEKDGWYWVTHNGFVDCDFYKGDRFVSCGKDDVIAWQYIEKPDPYEPPMTEAEAIKILRSKLDGSVSNGYKWCETVLLAARALEKRIPKRITDSYEYSYYCPECEKEVVYEAAYCHFCGQALEWED